MKIKVVVPRGDVTKLKRNSFGVSRQKENSPATCDGGVSFAAYNTLVFVDGRESRRWESAEGEPVLITTAAGV